MPILSAFGAAKTLGGPGAVVPAQNYSYDFNGSSFLSYPTNNAFAIGSLDFSIECFIYLQAVPTFDARILDFGYSNSSSPTYRNKLAFLINTSRQPTIARALSGGGQLYSSSIAVSLDTWTYIAVSRVSGDIYIFVNSSLGRNTVFAGTLVTSANPPTIGNGSADSNRRLTGKLSNLRFNVGSGFTSATVPTQPLTAQATTKILTCQSSTIKDNSVANGGGPWTITNSGVTVSTSGPF